MKKFIITCTTENKTVWYEVEAVDEEKAESGIRAHHPEIKKILEIREAEDVDINDYEPAEGRTN